MAFVFLMFWAQKVGMDGPCVLCMKANKVGFSDPFIFVLFDFGAFKDIFVISDHHLYISFGFQL